MKNYARSNRLFFINNGSILDATAEIADNLAPYSKVLIVACQKDISLSTEVLRRLKRSGRKVAQVIFPNGCCFSIKEACGLFCTAEDVRLVIAIGITALYFADYFSTIKALPVIAIADEYEDFFKNKIYIKKENGFDGFLVENKKTVIVCGQPDLKEIYAYLAICKFKLFCYYARVTFTGEDFDRKKVFDALYHVLNAEKSSASICDLEDACGFIGEIPDCDPTEIARLLFDCSLGDKLRYAEYATGLLYDVFVNGKLPPVPDYNQIAERVSQTFGFERLDVLKSLIESKKRLVLPANLCDFTAALVQTDACMKNAVQSYFSKDVEKNALTEQEKTAIKLSGDTPLGFNVVSVYKEYPFN